MVHYQTMYRRDDFEPVYESQAGRRCAACGEAARVRGYCHRCYKLAQRGRL